jgi:Family of unknown function (DUF5519)
MQVNKIRAMSYADRALSRVAAWPGVRRGRAACGDGTALDVSGRQVVHLHADGVAEVRLTWPVIGRLRRPLLESGRVQMVPGGDWVRLRLDTEGDVDLFASLTSVAIKANATRRQGERTGTCMAMTRTRIRDAIRGRWSAAVPDDLREPRLRGR